MNTINLTGRLTADPEEIETKKGSFAAFTVAVDRPFGDETDFFQCTSWGKTGENIVKYLSKGRRIGVTGRIEIDIRENNGDTKYYPKVRVERFTFLDSNNSSSSNNKSKSRNNNKSKKNKSSNNKKEQQPLDDDFDNNFDEDLDEDFDVPF